MAISATQWRLFCYTAQSGGANIAVAGLELRQTVGGSDTATGGTVSASYNNSSYPKENAFDSNPATFWWTTSNNQWIQYTFAAAVSIKEIKIFARNDGYFGDSPKSFVFQYYDGTTWITVIEVLNKTDWINGSTVTLPTDFTGHTYWRIYITANNGDATYTEVNELQFRTVAGTSSVPSGGTALSSTNNYTGPGAAFDNNVATGFLSQAGVPNWVGYQFASPISPVEVQVVSPLVNEVNRAPKDFLIQYSDDGSAWTTTASITSQTSWTTAQSRLFPVYRGTFSGNITESLAITAWILTATKCSDGTFAGTSISTGTTYTLDVNTTELCNIQIAQKVNYPWSANKVAALNEFVVTSNPETAPHLFKVTTVGAFAATEATWNLSGTTTQGTAVLTYVGPLVSPRILTAKIPS